jgi:hypothetical protein
MPLEDLFVAGTYRSRTNLKLRLLRSGLKDGRCEGCGLSEWRDRPLPLALHHVNGDAQDHRVENLQLLCPNCHSQTPNFSGRNRRGRRLAAAPAADAYDPGEDPAVAGAVHHGDDQAGAE